MPEMQVLWYHWQYALRHFNSSTSSCISWLSIRSRWSYQSRGGILSGASIVVRPHISHDRSCAMVLPSSCGSGKRVSGAWIPQAPSVCFTTLLCKSLGSQYPSVCSTTLLWRRWGSQTPPICFTQLRFAADILREWSYLGQPRDVFAFNRQVVNGR
jgi:hypothetical protein